MLFDIPFVADWRKIGDQRQLLTNHGNQQENAKRIDYHYKVGDKGLVINEGILRKSTRASSTRTDAMHSCIRQWPGPYALPITWHIKPAQVQQSLDKTCSSTFCL
jgi:hypothetical protein